MADSSSSAEVISVIESIITGDYCNGALLTFITYEYFITLSLEVDLFWRRRLTGAGILFLLNRYLTLALRASIIVEGYITSITSCAGFIRAYVIFDELQYLIWGAFSALRVLALSRSWLLTCAVGLLSIAPFLVNLAAYYGIMRVTGLVDPLYGCGMASTAPITLSQSTVFVSVSRGSLILADIAVLATTWWATYSRGGMFFGRRTLSYVMLVNGTGYFLVMLALHVAHLSLTLVGYSNPNGINTSEITAFAEPISSVLVSRFLLDLQETSERTLYLDSRRWQGYSATSDAGSGTLSFARVMGSIGGSIRHGESAEGETTVDGASGETSWSIAQGDPDSIGLRRVPRGLDSMGKA
ncbi:hypothetical protein BD311DRAFT_768004 [Dichomitus squalens]|uniref:DUF6533 domain-containing protein n=1 Tax=Dichomitus squalens TaxID=114155 RepID=A0A4Q9M9A8_9APHY|nr:hypothetical protein BD311DRAFT_768004 [Dichomitus squalens]